MFVVLLVLTKIIRFHALWLAARLRYTRHRNLLSRWSGEDDAGRVVLGDQAG